MNSSKITFDYNCYVEYGRLIIKMTTRKIKIKITMRYSYTITWMSKKLTISITGKIMEQWEHSSIGDMSTK